ncbi:PAQR family membrane homeostasis protein TrhA [Roseovarius nanhaiticus]|uniref:PAQR family membrane homeostasis protein TrhA n=1 Tax=Roseovarius nanhaiticus TaxID=573024 RepID=UPI00249049D1|nr:hemolysin III family protein [Roseovarius nanhaiticus]
MSYPAYSRGERLADAIVHCLGIALGIAAVAWLFLQMPGTADAGIWAALAVYSAALVIMLSASGAYHMLAHTVLRPALRRLDHAAIYVKIAGTFTPLAALLGTAFGYVTLSVVWALALAGAAAKLATGPGRMHTGFLPYLVLGWLGLTLFVPLIWILPWLSLGFLLAGGLLYTAGLAFYTWEKLRYSNAIWHVFVLMASACFFGGIVSAAGLLPTPS